MHFAVKPFSRVLLASNRELLFCNRGHVSAGAIQIWKYRLDVSTGNSVANEKKKIFRGRLSGNLSHILYECENLCKLSINIAKSCLVLHIVPGQTWPGSPVKAVGIRNTQLLK
jgi:hypothetical protein